LQNFLAALRAAFYFRTPLQETLATGLNEKPYRTTLFKHNQQTKQGNVVAGRQEIPVQHHGKIARSKFDTDKISKIILYLQASYESLHHSKTFHYTVDAAHVFNQHFSLFFTQAGGGLGAG